VEQLLITILVHAFPTIEFAGLKISSTEIAAAGEVLKDLEPTFASLAKKAEPELETIGKKLGPIFGPMLSGKLLVKSTGQPLVIPGYAADGSVTGIAQ
jgi:hypothetical protein